MIKKKNTHKQPHKLSVLQASTFIDWCFEAKPFCVVSNKIKKLLKKLRPCQFSENADIDINAKHSN